MNVLDGKSVLITGGTGSFGQAFIRYVLQHANPKRIVIYSRDELKQFEMAQKLNAPNVRYFIGDVRDRSRLERALHGIDTVIHAAAMKQVVASEYNPIECIMTNVMGAENLVNACINMKVEKLVALSTDKAVNPINLYGASKLCSDKLFVAANNMAGTDGCRFSVVRYGIVDLATAMAPDCQQNVTGIRPGEKLHEIMIPEDEARQTLEFDDFYVIQPSFHMWEEQHTASYGGRAGKPVEERFSYTSDKNTQWVSDEEFRALFSEKGSK